jgi:Domain of unknown function (DUF4276)
MNLAAGPHPNETMNRLVVHVEGPTEETFVKEVLGPHLMNYGYHAVWPRIVGNARLDRRSGGIKGWPSVRKDLIEHLQENRGCRATSMVDYYALPQTGVKAWPGRAEAACLPYAKRAIHVENALMVDIQKRVDYRLAIRFRPFVTMHEFEGLLFSDCRAFSNGIGKPGLERDFQTIRDQFASPEEINDSPLTAPSKRVEALVPGYSKPLLGVLAALEIGLGPMRAECPIFRRWLEDLETWLRNEPND